MPQILVVGARLQCPHGGVLRLLSGNPLLTVSGNAAITAGMEVGKSFGSGSPGVVSPCTVVNSSGTSTPCVISASATSGASTLLKVGTPPVLLSTAQGMAADLTAGPSPWSVVAPGETLANVSS